MGFHTQCNNTDCLYHGRTIWDLSVTDTVLAPCFKRINYVFGHMKLQTPLETACNVRGAAEHRILELDIA